VVAALLQNGVLVIVEPRTGGIVRGKRLGTEACFPHLAASCPGGAAFAVVGARRQVRLALVGAGGGRIRVYERDGRRRFTVRSPGDPFTEAAAGRLYVGSGSSLRVFDLATGAVRTRHPPTTAVLVHRRRP
jgi:hypothetical protein